MFITLEGIEGSGKTTQIRLAAEFLRRHGHNCVLTREPGGTPIGAAIRAVLLDPQNKDLAPLAELLLYGADRAQHLAQVVKPALARGQTVLCDRFFDATTAYQGYARGLDMELIFRLHEMVLGGFAPDLTLLFDLPPQTGLDRAWQAIQNGGRPPGETRFEAETLAFHEKVRNGYLDLAKKDPERFRIIDAAGSPDQVRGQVESVLMTIGLQ